MLSAPFFLLLPFHCSRFFWYWSSRHFLWKYTSCSSLIHLFLFIFTATSAKVPSDSIRVTQRHCDLHPYSCQGGKGGWWDAVWRCGRVFEMSHCQTDLCVSLGQYSPHSTFEGFKVQFYLKLFSKRAPCHKKRQWHFYTQSDGPVCLGSCRQRSGDLRVGAWGSESFRSLQCIILLCQGYNKIGCAVPFNEKKKTPDTRVLDRDEWRENGRREAWERERTGAKMSSAWVSIVQLPEVSE